MVRTSPPRSSTRFGTASSLLFSGVECDCTAASLTTFGEALQRLFRIAKGNAAMQIS